jgi:uncharacterized protein
MGRLLILLLIVAVVAGWVYQRVARLRATDAQRPGVEPKAPGPAVVQDMVACAHCGVHLPRSDAVEEGALHFCGDVHRRLGPRA